MRAVTIDLPTLRSLLAAGTPRPWSEGQAGAYNVVHFDGDDVSGVAQTHPRNAALICAAVNALPELSIEVEVARAAIKAARTALLSNGHCGEGNLAEMIARALAEARQAGRDEMHEVDRALMDADRAFDGALTRDWTGTIAERVRPLVAVYEAASAHVDKFRHTHDPLQGAAQLFDAVDAARKTGA